VALAALTHALVLRTFFPPYDQPSCVDIKTVSASLEGHAPGVSEGAVGRRIAERHDGWAGRLPREATDLWPFMLALSAGELLDLLAHCVSLSVNAVCNPLDRRPCAWAHADALARAVGLDMSRNWAPTRESYLGRVTKARILEGWSRPRARTPPARSKA
jgi:ParB family chromosome partitioning protein